MCCGKYVACSYSFRTRFYYLNLVIGLIKENKDILNELNLPEGFVPIVGVGIGYADGSHIREHLIDVDYIK